MKKVRVHKLIYGKTDSIQERDVEEEFRNMEKENLNWMQSVGNKKFQSIGLCNVSLKSERVPKKVNGIKVL